MPMEEGAVWVHPWLATPSAHLHTIIKVASHRGMSAPRRWDLSHGGSHATQAHSRYSVNICGLKD